jgi:hypothetical protein
MRPLALGLLLTLAACNRHGAADVTLDADATARNATAAKTETDLAAADAASRGPAPVVRDSDPVRPPAGPAPSEPAPAETGEAPATDEQPAPFSNQ